MKLKYIITENYSPIIFPESLAHSDVAIGLNVKSAGYVSVDYNTKEEQFECTVHGESISLKIKCDKNDEFLLNRILNKQYE